jgi:hypothetical protein
MMIWRYPPKVISFSEASGDLGQFVYVDDVDRDWSDFGENRDHPPARHGPAGEMTKGTIVRDGDDSLYEEFYCYKGAWMVRVFD